MMEKNFDAVEMMQEPSAPATPGPAIGFVNSNHAPAPEIAPPTYYEAFQGLNPPSSKSNQPFAPRYDVAPVHLGREMAYLVCPYCFKQTQTNTDQEFSTATDACAWFLCLIGWPLLLFLVPYCVATPKKIHHYCRECKQYIGESYMDNELLKHRLAQIKREMGES